ncbi:MAG TPA: adenylate/guanylate cyclase domain-containing protein [Gemmatimonadota bacterium]|nr:adenylate/guanylate cyclase domain-containing protein [Gemmatimonadota bacterium]
MSAFERALATILFTDIVGSTERAAELGDRRWREVLANHHAAIRREVKRFGGRVVSTAGDGFLALFDEPSLAIHCASAARGAVRDDGIEIRSGIHMGAIDHAGGDVGGLGVHIASRVTSMAGPGEILVSSTVRDAESGSEFGFEEAGVHALKGVPGEWRLFRVTGVPEMDVGRIRRRSRRGLPAAGIAALVLIAVAAIYLIRREAAGPMTPEDALAADAAPGIAVLPFRVNDPALETWRDGMVDLLSINLDGIPGIRPIASRTVMARWEEQVAGEADPDLAMALDVAGRTGARYAIVGSAVGISSGIRLTGEIFDLENGERLGSAQVEGPTDDVWGLIDRLAIEVVKVVLGDAQSAPEWRGLADVTTDSLEALKLYLEGQQLYRRARFTDAAERYLQAIAVDSTFALAEYARGVACPWVPFGERRDAFCENTERIAALVDRLPEREAAYARTTLTGDLREGLELRPALVRRYPDDPWAWYLLGDLYVHTWGQLLLDPEEGNRALRRSIELAPVAAPMESFIHLLEAATADSAQLAEMLEAARLFAGGTDFFREFQLAGALMYGDSTTAAQAREEFRGLDTQSAANICGMIGDPRFATLREELCEELLVRPDLGNPPLTALNHLGSLVAGGKLEAALVHVDDPVLFGLARTNTAYHLHRLGVSLPPDVVRSAQLSIDQQDGGTFLTLFYAGAYAADQANWSDHRRAVEALRAMSRREGAAEAAGADDVADSTDVPDSVATRLLLDAASALEGYALWKQGNAAGAARVLEAQQQRIIIWPSTYFTHGVSSVNSTIRLWLGEIAFQTDRWEDTVRYLETLRGSSLSPYNALALGRAYEELGEYEKARETYERALIAWRDADPELTPRIQQIQEALATLPKPLRRER